MPGIDPSVITHRLNVSPSSKPIRQKKRVFAPEREKAIKEEVQKLTTAQFIQEVYYPDWLANVVMVKKANGDALRSKERRGNLSKVGEPHVSSTNRTECGGVRGRHACEELREGSHLDDLQETFKTLRRYKMKLNPSKCAFGVSLGKFLGFMVSEKGIEANPDKIQAILNIEPPKNIKEVQSLTGRVAALNRFVSKATDKCLPFFKILRKAFEWTDKCQRVFQDLKHYLTTAPLLSPTVLGDELYLYLAMSPHAVSSALIREEEKVQKPVYYTSRALRGAEERYPLIEKLAFALITASRKLRHYFQVELGEFDIRYQPRNAIKAQALANFIAEFTPSYEDLDDKEDNKKWVVHVDGSSILYAGGIGVVLQSRKGDKLNHKVHLQYQTTNNEAEYEAFLKGLELAKSVKADSILVLGDSQEENIEADTLAKEAFSNEAMKFGEIQYMPSIDLPEILQIEGEENWMTPIISYLRDGRLPERKDETRKLRVKSARYVLMDEVLYKRGFSQPYRRCLAPDEANYMLREVHEGACRNHSGARSLVHKVISAGYYWPTVQAYAKAYVEWGLDMLGPFPTRTRQMKTTARTPTGETPFKLAYGSEAVIPAEVHMVSHRMMKYHDEENNEQLRLNFDLIDKVRMDAEQRTVRYKNLMAKQHNAMVKPRRFSIGDLILKRVSLATKNRAHRKLGPNWEGPYRIINSKRQGSYYLEALDGRKLEYPLNVEHLRRYYQ
nr:uncharacterized protein LOC112004870 [Quercus suber]